MFAISHSLELLFKLIRETGMRRISLFRREHLTLENEILKILFCIFDTPVSTSRVNDLDPFVSLQINLFVRL